MGRWRAGGTFAALIFSAAVALAQTGQAPAQAPDDAALYDDVMLLTTIRTLGLTQEQMTRALELNARVLNGRQEMQSLREATWAQNRTDIEAVMQAWMEGRQPSTRASQAADRAVRRANEARADQVQREWNAAESLYSALTANQRRLVESPEEARLRSERLARMGGTEAVGEFVAARMDAIRDLMPEEFRMLAASEARQIAEVIVGPDAGNLPQMADAVLGILAQAYQWTPQQYAQQRLTLPAQIEASLGLTGISERPPVEWEDLLRVVRSPRLQTAAADLGMAQPPTRPVPTFADTDDLQDALDRADALNLFRQIGLAREQAAQMNAPLQRIQDLGREVLTQRTQSLSRLRTTLERARGQLVAGGSLPEQVQSALASDRQQRRNAQVALYRSVDQQMQLVAQMLTPAQNALLDWTPPPSVRPQQELTERLRAQQVLEGRIEEALAMLQRVKYLDAFNFVTGRGPIVNEYLSIYFRPNTVEYQQAYQIVIAYTDEVRLIDDQQWLANGREIGRLMIDELGLMPTIEPLQRPGTVGWNTLYRVLTNEETLDLVRELGR
ncbi:MAG: hypothetical protein GX131_05705 [candidate division WS1 bacterium]|nr:hypothetical protein [candidate division WS1 bacterium]